jgi:transitional endoplasmic reticulum ATPase
LSAHDQRIAGLRAAVEVAPSDAALQRMLAESLEADRRWDEAIAARRTVLRLAPDDTQAHIDLAGAYLGAGRREPAEVILDTLEASGHESTDVWRLRGRLLGIDAQGPLDGDQPAASIPEPGKAGEPVAASPEAEPDLERPTIGFADVGGMTSLKEAIRLKIVYPSLHPEIYAAYGQSSGGGLLLYGPPGCGKTHLARATAGEMGAAFLAIGISDVLNMYIGESERRMHEVFETARQHTPCVLFFDEIDALAANRSDFRSVTGRSVVNQFLAELDGVASTNEGILVLGATNAPWHLDPAFRRPGRFDDVLFVPPPDAPARAEIVRILLRDRPVARIDIDAVVKATERFSGADLRGLVEKAVRRKLEQSLRDGTVRPVETRDLLDAAKETIPSTREWFATARNYVTYANESGLYDPVRPYLP